MRPGLSCCKMTCFFIPGRFWIFALLRYYSWRQYTSALIVIFLGSSSNYTIPSWSHHTQSMTFRGWASVFTRLSGCLLWLTHAFRCLKFTYRHHFSSPSWYWTKTIGVVVRTIDGERAEKHIEQHADFCWSRINYAESSFQIFALFPLSQGDVGSLNVCNPISPLTLWLIDVD